MQRNTLRPHGLTASLLNRNAVRATAIALALATALHAVRGHAQDGPADSSDAAEDVPTLIIPQQDADPSDLDAGSSVAEPNSTPDQENSSEQADTPAATVLFDPGTAELTREATAILDAVRQQFSSTGQSAIRLTGHTDPVESAAGAKGLSQARALAVGNYLNNAGVPADQIVVRGVADEAPATDPSNCGNLEGEALARCLAPDRSVDIEVVTSSAEAPLQPSSDDAATSQETQ